MMDNVDQVRLIGLVGLAGCGKDTLASQIEPDGWTRIAFADALKDMCVEYLGLSKDDAYTQEGKMRFNEFWGMTNREILQKVGTEAFRNGFHKDTWVKIAELKVKRLLSEGKKVVVTDCRFDNEAEMIIRLGGVVVQIVRSELKSVLSKEEQSHASERGVDVKYVGFAVANDGTIEEIRDNFYKGMADYLKLIR